MTGKAQFSEQEWDLVRMAPAPAGLIVIASERGGTLRETFEMAQTYADTRKKQGNTELLDAVVAAKPERDHQRYHSVDELKQAGLGHLREAIELLEAKATPDEVDEFRGFVVEVARRVAERHEEDGRQVSPSEQAALDEIAGAVAAG
jgi:hypothetical protein